MYCLSRVHAIQVVKWKATALLLSRWCISLVMENDIWQFETEVSEIFQCTQDIKTFRFDVSGRRDVRYQADQFLFVTIKIDGREAVHHFSLSSSPTETDDKGYIEFTKRITNSEYSQALDAIQPGAWARLRGAKGDFILPYRQQNLAFLCGGIGITPIRSMLRYIADKKLQYDVVLICGSNILENTPFRDELDEMAAAHDNIRVEYVLCSPDIPPHWEGKRGFITREVVIELIPEHASRLYYLSGPLRMVQSLEEQLAQANIPQKQIKRDYFPGYD